MIRPVAALAAAASALSLALALLAPERAAAVHALTVPSGSAECAAIGAAGNGVVDQMGTPQLMPQPDGSLDVLLAADASHGLSLPGLYLGSMSWVCTLSGAASLDYGHAAATLSVMTSSTPDSLPPDVANMGNPPFQNDGRATGLGNLGLRFDDSGVVQSATLPPGTPVVLQFVFSLHETEIETGAPPALVNAAATYQASATDPDNGSTQANALLTGNQVAMPTLAAKVGDHIDLQAVLNVGVHAQAGREMAGAIYYPQAEAAVDAGNTATFEVILPDGVQFVAESGHDYTASASACPDVPADGCVEAAKASLSISETKDGKESLKATLSGFAQATSQSDFGDPVAGPTAYDICIYDGNAARVGALAIHRAGATCGSKPCWADRGGKGWSYKDPDAASDGARSLSAAGGPTGKGKLAVAAGNNPKKGQTHFPTGIPARLEGDSSVILRIQTDDALCYQATLETVKKAEHLLFKAKKP